MSIALNTVSCLDLFELCDQLDDRSIDCILCDLPYGSTACAWDSRIPFKPMWKRFKRVIKPKGAIVLTASQPFTSALVMSNLADFNCEWIWYKTYPSNPFLSDKQPLRTTESVLVFAEESPHYYPQMRARPREWMRERPSNKHKNGGIFGKEGGNHSNSSDKPEMYPINLIDCPLENPLIREHLHPTQKPVKLFRYLIRTYTQPGELVLDPCVGSGTTCLAAREEGRNFICGDSSIEYVEVARKRLAEPYTVPMFQV